MSLENQNHIRGLDGWRAVSVLLVIVHHLFIYRFPLMILGHPALADFCANAGPLGVRIFFVISGFVICRLIISEDLRFGSISIKGSYYRRIFRILPPLYLFLATLVVHQAAGLISAGWKAIVVAGLFLTNLQPGSCSWFAGHTWSLAVEEQFYLIFPTLVHVPPLAENPARNHARSSTGWPLCEDRMFRNPAGDVRSWPNVLERTFRCFALGEA